MRKYSFAHAAALACAAALLFAAPALAAPYFHCGEGRGHHRTYEPACSCTADHSHCDRDGDGICDYLCTDETDACHSRCADESAGHARHHGHGCLR